MIPSSCFGLPLDSLVTDWSYQVVPPPSAGYLKVQYGQGDRMRVLGDRVDMNVVILLLTLALASMSAVRTLQQCNPPDIVNVTDLIVHNKATNITAIHFTHIKKCGGTTLDHLLKRFEYVHNIELDSTERVNIDPIRVFEGSSRKQSSRDKKCSAQHKLVLVIVRDPMKRLISHFNQMRPWDNRVGGDTACSKAAAKGFKKFVNAKRCKYSKNFMSSYHDNRIMEVLPQYSLVIPFEHYNTGLVLLHMYCGFKVEDILYLVQKNYTDMMPPVEISDADIELALPLQNLDFQLYNAAQQQWNHTIAPLLADKTNRLQRSLDVFTKLLDDFHGFYHGYNKENHCFRACQMRIIDTFCGSDTRCNSNSLQEI